MKRLSPAQITALKWLIWLAAGLPLLWLPLAASQDGSAPIRPRTFST